MKRVLILVLALILVLNLIGCGQRNTTETVQCPHCNADNLKDARFCSACGEPLTQTDHTSTVNMSSQPKETEKTEATAAFSEGTILPTEAATIPTESVTSPTEITLQSTKATTPPPKATTVPTKATTSPTKATTVPTKATTPPTKATTVPTKATTSPTKATTVPTKATTSPTKATTPPTKATALPTQPTTPGYIMQNTGADGVYYGNSVCVDGNRIYLGYYGKLYIFDGGKVTTYAGGGTKSTTIAEMYLYNGYVYYVDMDQHCLRSINAANGNDAVILSEIGEIGDSFMYGKNLYLSTVDHASEPGYFSVDLEALAHKSVSQKEYKATAELSIDDSCQWDYYLAWGSNNLCRENKQTKTQEVLVKSGSGKNYAIKEILYADDTRIVFKRSRMADGVEFSIWSVDSDGKNLTELLRKEYHGKEPILYPTAKPNDSDSPAAPKTCELCQGDGRVTCNYCNGTGKGKPIAVMGILTEQGCTYCGSAGWRLCSGCGGRGEQ